GVGWASGASARPLTGRPLVVLSAPPLAAGVPAPSLPSSARCCGTGCAAVSSVAAGVSAAAAGLALLSLWVVALPAVPASAPAVTATMAGPGSASRSNSLEDSSVSDRGPVVRSAAWRDRPAGLAVAGDDGGRGALPAAPRAAPPEPPAWPGSRTGAMRQPRPG